MTGSKIPEFLEEMKQKWPRLAPKYLRSDSLEDILFKANYNHIYENIVDSKVAADSNDREEKEKSCQFCDRTKLVRRKPRDMRIHYGLITSGNQVIKTASFRDKLNKDLGGHILCIEIEAVGLMHNFPCIAVQGICNYIDSYKNKN